MAAAEESHVEAVLWYFHIQRRRKNATEGFSSVEKMFSLYPQLDLARD